MVNIFDNPEKYLRELRAAPLISPDKATKYANEFNGLSIAYVWLTRSCPLNCEYCFFKSGMRVLIKNMGDKTH